VDFINTFLKFSLSVSNLWLFTGVFLLLNTGFIILFPKHNIGRFIKMPKVNLYTKLNQISYYLLFVLSVFIPIKTGTILFYVGLFLFVSGVLLYATALFYFAISEYDLPVTRGIYKFSRHPVYLSFFVINLGMILVSSSLIVFIIAFLHFYALVFIIKEEEKLCAKQYGKNYSEYRQKTKKYL